MKSLVLLLFLLISPPILSDELIMINHESCIFCRNFLETGKSIYENSRLNKEFPLSVVNVDDSSGEKNEWIVKAFREGRRKGIIGTPTFLLWKGDRETGREEKRIVGFSDIHKFLKLVEQLINEISAQHNSSNRPTSRIRQE